MSGCRRHFDETKYMFFFKKYNEILRRVSNIIKKEFNSEPL